MKWRVGFRRESAEQSVTVVIRDNFAQFAFQDLAGRIAGQFVEEDAAGTQKCARFSLT